MPRDDLLNPDYNAGHRRRLRDRFLKTGPDRVADYELLELVLFQSRPRGDVKPLAKMLLDRFGSFSEIISAPAEDLMKVRGVGESTAIALKAVRAAAVRLMQEQVRERAVVSSWDQLIAYCRAAMGFSKREQFRVLFLDKKNRIIADEVLQEGTVDHTPVYPREVVARALDLGATALILVHNHPSGDTTPSRADIEMTNQIRQAASVLGIVLHDHIIVGRAAHTSFKARGLL
ncbi:RadC family protein [Nisaea sediminum]|uniref:RadC family protein n=1 Tax=Nisaea sediminum TaxID=2775867 RepID=UPI0018679A43|nr:DNA repair protein RadC [Nisaea sediminum]